MKIFNKDVMGVGFAVGGRAQKDYTKRKDRGMNSWCESCERKNCCYTLLLAYKMHDDKIETVYKTAVVVLEHIKRKFEEERAERCSKESETSSQR